MPEQVFTHHAADVARELSEGIRLRNAPEETWQARQMSLLRSHLVHAASLPFYRRLFRKCGVEPGGVRDMNDLAGLPMTSRHDLDRHGDDFVRDKGLSDINLTSGITGKPVIVPYTAGDLERLALNEAFCFTGAGIGRGSRVLLTVTLDRCFVAGLAYYSGLLKVGAEVIRSGAGQPAMQWQVIERLAPDVIVGVPSFLARLAKWGEARGIDVKNAGIRKLVTIGEPVRRPDFSALPVCRELEEMWNARVFGSYGATEMETAFCECGAGRGGHVHPDLIVTEVVDSQGAPLPPGQAGEVVVTPLGVEGMPLVRFRTGDVARLHVEPCGCGWTTPRLGPIEGRLAHRLKFHGTTIYPEGIFQALQECGGVDMSYVEVRSSEALSDRITVVLCGENPDPEEIRRTLQARLRVMPEVRVEGQDAVYARVWGDGGRKPRRFFDLREAE